MLFFKVEKKYWSQLKTFLVFLNIMPIGFIAMDEGVEVPGYDIPLDDTVADALGKI
jgi:hypothetical protein